MVRQQNFVVAVSFDSSFRGNLVSPGTVVTKADVQPHTNVQYCKGRAAASSNTSKSSLGEIILIVISSIYVKEIIFD